MSFIAPNLSIIVGASTAAKIMGERCKKMSLHNSFCNHSVLIPMPSFISLVSLAAGIAGGLTNLSKMPACNLMLLGAQRRTLSGFSSTSLLPHTGFIYHCDVVQSLPPVSKSMHIKTVNEEYLLTPEFLCFCYLPAVCFNCLQDLRRKAARLVAAKCTLASRVDSFHESSDGKVMIQKQHAQINTHSIL